MEKIKNQFLSDVSGKQFPLSEKVYGKSVTKKLLTYIQSQVPDFKTQSNLSISELNEFRKEYISNILSKEVTELSNLEKNVLTSMDEKTLISDKESFQELSFGQRIADKVASFGGSWTFIISFGVFILIWITINVLWLKNQAFDAYPFILLNLILSCVAALQAPVIMMSQNRQEEKDRERSKQDYMINLKSELEIRILHEKIDHMIIHQQQELLDIQQVQIDLLNDILERIDKNK